MQIQEHTTKAIEPGTQFEVQTSIEVDLNFPNAATHDSTPETGSNQPTLRLFESIARTTFAERFPLLTLFAISCACLLVPRSPRSDGQKGWDIFCRDFNLLGFDVDLCSACA